ncbi:MAG: hypothetical protein C0391_03790 [Anaerolinea sp.]|nr:hypothetical protein [Anaerolinea sp.]
MNKLINITHFRAVFSLFVYLCVLALFEVHKIQSLNFRNFMGVKSTKSDLFGQMIQPILYAKKALRIVRHDKTKLTDPYKYTKYTKYTAVKMVRRRYSIIMSKLMKYTPFHPLFDVLVYLCVLTMAQPVFLCYLVIIQLLNFVYFKIMKYTQVHAEMEIEHE